MSKCRYDLSEDCHNKDCLVCVLNKIRAEIETWHKEGTNWSDIRLMEIEDILDEYKAESEDKGNE